MVQPKKKTDDCTTGEREKKKPTYFRARNQPHQKQADYKKQSDGMCGPLAATVRAERDRVFGFRCPDVPGPKVHSVPAILRCGRTCGAGIERFVAVLPPQEKTHYGAAGKQGKQNRGKE